MNNDTTDQRRNVAGDAWGGLAAMLVALPSAIAFGVAIFSPLGGTLAAQGALAGILGATALGLVSPLLGGSTRLITAPCAPAAAVLSALAIEFARQGMAAEMVLLLLSLIGLLAGAIQIGLGLAGIGRLIKYIPFPVVSGYLCGVGLIIIGSQIPKFLGAPGGTGLLDALKAPSAWTWQSMVVGGVVIVAMVFTPRLTRAVPAAILALIAGIACYLGLGLLDPGLMRTENNPLLIGALSVGDDGLADAVIQHWRAISGLGLDLLLMVGVPSLTLAVLLSIDTLKTCLVIDAMTNAQHNSNRELMGQGLGNIASSLIGGIPGAGTMGASLVNISSGGKTKLSGLMTGLFSLAAYLLFSPLIAWVPVAALAAILIVIGFRMIDWHSLAFFFTPSTRFDFLVIMAVILVAIFGNLIAASGVGVALAILLFIREQTRSSVVHNRIEGGAIFSKRSRSRQDMELLAREGTDTVVFELQGSLFFGTANQLFAALEPETHSRKYVILNMRRVQSLDITATHVLEQIKDRLEERDAYLVFCDIPKGLPSGLKMKRFLKETGVVRPTNKAFAFRQLDEALEWVESRKLGHGELEDTESPLLTLRDMRVFAGCSDADFAALEAVVESHGVAADKKVFKAGAGDEALFLIRRGRVKILVPIHKKQSYHLATCGPGDIIGGMGFVEARGHAADALALTDCEVYMLSRHQFDALEKEHPLLALAIIETVALGLSGRLRVTIGELQALRG
ncbi:Sulfate permease and related transporter [Candidatus Terasakiella magnetica]|nr:Sulfate permease and related transporter [Candidatus Terasakiella magnetica]